jgi:hypothetical protein
MIFTKQKCPATKERANCRDLNMRNLPAPRHRRNKNFDINPIRRAEIIRHAIHVNAMDTEDRDRWLVAHTLHNQSAKDQVWGVIRAAQKMGGGITRAEAIAIVDEANAIPHAWGADRLAKHLGVTYPQRTILGITTIGARDFSKRQRSKQRRYKDRRAKTEKRRAAGMHPQSESLSATQPWKELGVSRATWYRRNKARSRDETTLSAACLISTDDRPVSLEREERNSSGAVAPKKARGLPSSQTATMLAADRYWSLPLELRMAALCLPLPENLARAA